MTTPIHVLEARIAAQDRQIIALRGAVAHLGAAIAGSVSLIAVNDHPERLELLQSMRDSLSEVANMLQSTSTVVPR